MYPTNLFYTKEHEYLQILSKANDGDIARIGITHFAQKELGDIVFVDILKQEKVIKDQVFGSIEAVKVVSDLFSPVSGKIININNVIIDNPELINEDPYGNWIIEIEITNSDELLMLLTSSEYKKLINEN